MVIEIIIGLIILGAGLYFYNEYKTKATATAVVPSANDLPFPCVIEGTVDGSPMIDRIKALAIEAETKGTVITGDYVADYTKQGGEMHLTGSGFRFVISNSGQIVDSMSYVNVFDENYPCEGGMNPDGSLGISVVVTDKVTGGVAKLGVSGSVANGKLVSGKLSKGQLPHIYSVLSGTHVPVVK